MQSDETKVYTFIRPATKDSHQISRSTIKKSITLKITYPHEKLHQKFKEWHYLSVG